MTTLTTRASAAILAAGAAVGAVIAVAPPAQAAETITGRLSAETPYLDGFNRLTGSATVTCTAGTKDGLRVLSQQVRVADVELNMQRLIPGGTWQSVAVGGETEGPGVWSELQIGAKAHFQGVPDDEPIKYRIRAHGVCMNTNNQEVHFDATSGVSEFFLS